MQPAVNRQPGYRREKLVEQNYAIMYLILSFVYFFRFSIFRQKMPPFEQAGGYRGHFHYFSHHQHIKLYRFN